MALAQQKRSFKGWGSIFIGIVLLAPFGYNSHATDNAIFILPLIAGISLLLIGLIKLKASAQGVIDVHAGGEQHNLIAPESKHNDNKELNTLSTLLMILAVLALIATVLGAAYMMVFVKQGGSGVAIVFGILIAGVLLVLSSLARQSRR